MVLFQTTVFLLFLSGNCFSMERVKENHRLLDKMISGQRYSTYQHRFKRQNPVQGYQKYLPAVQPNVVVMSSGSNTGYGGVPSAYDGGSTVVIKMPNDVYNSRMPAYPNVMTRG